MSSTANPTQPGQAVTFTATVSNMMGGIPTSSVTFMDGTTVLGTETLTQVNGQTQATFTTSSLGLGTHAILAVYSGDDTLVESGSSLNETITN
ncbi:MAG TPA: Ig-like domain-containing protein [Gemmataceae bacterium]|nr:Ig-like domain-containing protein [Gemmataceae bacterium]